MSDESNVAVILSAISRVTGSSIDAHPGIEKTSVFELGIDSLNVVELIFQLEQDLNIDIPLTELEEDVFRSISRLDTHLGRLKTSTVAAF